MMKHAFTTTILAILEEEFPKFGETIFDLSPLLQYLNQKTRSANRGAKARSNLSNLYAIYVLIEDYQSQGFAENRRYASYEGARFGALIARIKALPYGAKFQNHSLNSRTNDEFRKFFPAETRVPIQRNLQTRRYWITESLLQVSVGPQSYSIGEAVLRIIDVYVATKRQSLSQFIADCQTLQSLPAGESAQVVDFIRSLLAPEKDARLFEIASYAVLKTHFESQIVFMGDTRETVEPQRLQLFKTGRTNANDGGIDFVMRPVGRFFQVTETLDVKKYFLDIDKVEHFPLSFVIKSQLSPEEILAKLRADAQVQYGVDEIINRYMAAIEEVWNIPQLLLIFEGLVNQGQASAVLEEIVMWSQIEFQHGTQIAEEVEEVAESEEETPV